jgi:integrase/recombinase XerD
MYRAWMEQRGLASSTIDRRLSSVCGYYRFAHIDGRIASNPAQYVRRPRVHPAAQRGMDRNELATFVYTAERVSPMHAALAVLLGLNGLRVSEACGANIEDLGFERGHRSVQIIGKGNKRLAEAHSVLAADWRRGEIMQHGRTPFARRPHRHGRGSP